MREYELIIDKALTVGLSSGREIPSGNEELWIAKGFRVGKNVLEGYEVSNDDPLAGRVDLLYSWPFPQFIQGERYNFLVVRDSVVNFEDKVYVIDDDYTVTWIFDCDVATFGTGTLMEVADFGEYVIMVNGVIMIYWNAGVWHEVRSTVDIPMMRTMCNFKGQIVGGNVLGVWNAIALVYDDWHDCDETSYIWSKIGEAVFTPDRGNVSGYRRDPYGGEVYHTKRLGDGVIGYSSKGVVLMTPVSEPAATFAFIELSDVGLLNQGAMDGNLDRHVYVGADLILREITKEGIKELGYYRYMENVEGGEDVIVKYDRRMKDFYIGNDEETYLLSPYGLTEVPQHPSAIWVIPPWDDDESNMLPNTVDDYEPTIASGILDMGYRGQKTVFSVETDALLVLEPEAAIWWMESYDVGGDTGYVPINDQGIAAIICAGSDLAVSIKFKVIASVLRLNYIKIRYKMTDLRGIRGVYAPPLRGQ